MITERKRFKKMAKNFTNKTLKFFTIMLLVGIPSTCAHPFAASDDHMIHNDNYDMIMMDDHEPAESMHLQNFDEFYKMDDDTLTEMEMDESRNYMIRVPQPLNAKEKHARQHLEVLDAKRERNVQRSLVKGSSKPRSNVNDWEKFDYDMLLKHH